MQSLLGLPELGAARGAEIDQLIGYVHILMAILFVGWMVLFLYMLFRFRSGKHPQATYTGPSKRWSTSAEAGVAVAELILLAAFSIPIWYSVVSAFPEPTEAVEVRLVGEQFAWTAHYPGPDGVFGRAAPELVDVQTNPLGLDPQDPAGGDDIVSVNQLHLPVDEPVIVHLSSKDVIHSFMLNEMRVKQDAVPGLETPVHFVPTVTTAEMRERIGDPAFNYEIACAQLCGFGHYRMRGFLTVETRAEYEAWLAAQAPVPDDGSGASVWD